MLDSNEVERQLTARRTEIEDLKLALSRLQTQLNGLHRNVSLGTIGPKTDAASGDRLVSVTDKDAFFDLKTGNILHLLPHYFTKTTTFGADLLPSATDTVNLGASGNEFLNVWAKIVHNIHQDTLANIPAALGVSDVDYLFLDTTYYHLYRWTGTIWEFLLKFTDLPGSFQFFDHDPGAGWHICDGSTVTRTKPDGTGVTESVVLPNATGCYVKHGTYSATPVNAVAATITGSTASATVAVTGDIAWPAGVPDFTGTALGTHQHTTSTHVSGTTLAISVAPYGAGSTVTGVGTILGAGSSFSFTGDLTESKSAGTPSGTVAWPVGVPTFSQTGTGGHTHGVGTLVNDTTAEPKHLVLPLYMRL